MVSNIWSKQNRVLQEFLKEVRISAQLTQQQLARKINRHQSYISKYESGERRLDLIELKEIVENCNISLNRFVLEFTKRVEKKD